MTPNRADLLERYMSSGPADVSELLKGIVQKIKGASRVQLIGHVRPDGDCVGSLLATHHILDHLGIDHRLAAEEHVEDTFAIFSDYGALESAPHEGYDPDLTIFLDCANRNRAFSDWKPPGATINIDHHRGNSNFADLNWVDPECAAVGEMIYYLASYTETPLDTDIAEILLLAIMTDTGSFQYSNVMAHHLDMCGTLLRAGADIVKVARAAYENRSPESVHLLGSVLSAVKYRCDGRLVLGEIRKEALENAGGSANLPQNLASELRAIRNVKVALMFTETPDGRLRLSLRGDGSIDVNAIAREFGGGGHRNASGLTIEDGKFESNRDRIVTHVEDVLNKDG